MACLQTLDGAIDQSKSSQPGVIEAADFLQLEAGIRSLALS